MRILYLLRSKAYFTYHESIIRSLCRGGHRVELLFDEGWSKGVSDHALQDFLRQGYPLKTGWAIRRSGLMRQPLFVSRELLSYAGYLNRKEQSEYYLNRWKGYLPRLLRLAFKSRWARSLLAKDDSQEKLRKFERRAPPDKRIIRWLEEHRPDIVVASPINMRYSEEVEYIKAAQALGIPTVVPVLSWDNLTTKGLFHIIPDLTLVWNQAHFDEAVSIHRVPPEKIVITGSPFFDKWFEAADVNVTREEFCRKVGLDASKPFIAYLGSSANIARDETWLVRELVSCLRQHPNPDFKRAGILVRPHPANARIYEQLNEDQVSVWPRKGTLPDSEESKQDFLSTLRYSIATVGINTTGMIDAVIADQPCITIMPEQYRATQTQAVHFQHLLESGALEVVSDAAQCVDAVERLWNGVDSKKEARRRFVRQFVRPHGLARAAGEMAAQAIEIAALKQSASEINTVIKSVEMEAAI
jgi:hypothetical protein